MHFIANEPNPNTPSNVPPSLTALPKPLVGQALAKHTIATTAAVHGKSTAADSSAASSDNNKDKKTEHGLHEKGKQVMVSLTSGAIAGAVAKTAIAPLDRTKIHFQIYRDKKFSFRAVIEFLRITYKHEGFAGLYRGNSATMARIVPYAAIQFTAHEQWRKFLGVDMDGRSTNFRRFLAGSLAGVTSQSLTYPLDLARARMAVTPTSSDNKLKRTLRQVLVRIWVDEGPRTLLRGYSATIWGVIPYAGTSFFTYETLKRHYYEMPGEKTHTAFVMLLFGAAAGAIGQTASYPLDIVRRRMQTENVVPGAKQQYTTIMVSLRNIYKNEGVRNGFFKGLSMNWIKGPLAVGISFSTYDVVKGFLKNHVGST